MEAVETIHSSITEHRELMEADKNKPSSITSPLKISGTTVVPPSAIAKPTATRDLSELVEYGIFKNTGKGAGSYYEIIGS